jgi:hypothetical protein
MQNLHLIKDNVHFPSKRTAALANAFGKQTSTSFATACKSKSLTDYG